MTTNLLFGSTDRPYLHLYTEPLAQIHHIYQLTLYELLHFLMASLRMQLADRLNDDYLQDVDMFEKIKKAVISMQFDGDETLFDGYNTLTYDVMCSKLLTKFTYRSSYGERELAIMHHTEEQWTVFLDFIVYMLHAVDNVEMLKNYQVDWIPQWPHICEEWSVSFTIGHLINIPQCLQGHWPAPHIVATHEMPLLN